MVQRFLAGAAGQGQLGRLLISTDGVGLIGPKRPSMPPGSNPLTANSRCIPSTMGVQVVARPPKPGFPS